MRVLCFFLLTFSALVLGQDAERQDAPACFIERIEICGTRRVQVATVRSLILARTGAPYTGAGVQRDVRALRDSGYFDEVRVSLQDSSDEPYGRIVTFQVTEKPVIRRVEYRGMKSISDTDIQNAYEHNKINLSVEGWFDLEKLAHAATVIQELLAAHGHPSATVTPTYDRTASSNVVTILFTIDEGPEAQPAPKPR